MVKMTGVSKSFRNSRFHISNVNLHIPKGYIMGLIGENGAGKTTLLRMLLGLAKPNKGDIEIFGMDYSNGSADILEDIGFVMVEDYFPKKLRIGEGADYFGGYYCKYDKTLMLEKMKQYHLNPKSPYGKLSKGEKLKYQFAFALSHHPKLLVLDEPTANFDPEFRKDFIKELTHFVEDGEHSVILATHIMEDLEQIGDYITFVKEGEILFSMDREELENRYRLLYGEEYLLRNLPKEQLIYIEKGANESWALVEHKSWHSYDAQLRVEVPGLNDLFYAFAKIVPARSKLMGEMMHILRNTSARSMHRP